jgi:16S rRNA (cytosine967-C5)-methyltransferase
MDPFGLAASVVASCLGSGDGLAEVMARSRDLRREPAATKAIVLRAAAATIAGLRRSQFLYGPFLAPLRPEARARVLVLVQAVFDGQIGAEHAAVSSRREVGVDVPVLGPAVARARIDAIDGDEERFAVAHSLPDWAAARLRSQDGGHAGQLAAALVAAPPRTLRANLLRVHDAAALVDELGREGIVARVGAHASTAVHVEGDADLFATRAFVRGAFEQQDEASQLAVACVAPPPGGRVLDLCAGTGGKTLALAAQLGNRGVVCASDVHEGKLRGLRQRLARSGADNVRIEAPDGDDGGERLAAFARRADRILVDAPCSGTGSWRRRPEARWTIDEAALASLRETQLRLLRQAAAWLQPGARLVYATCSLLEEENSRQVDTILGEVVGLEVVRLAEILGSRVAAPISDAGGRFLVLRPDLHGCDGFFLAVLRRRR